MTRRSRKPLGSGLNVHGKTTKNEAEVLESCNRATKGWCKVFNENKLVPDLEQNVFRLDSMLLGNVNKTSTDGCKLSTEDVGKEKLTSHRQIRARQRSRTRNTMEDLEAKAFAPNSLTCDGNVDAQKEGFKLEDHLVKESFNSSLTVTLSVASNKSRESSPRNFTSVKNLYMELQNGESSGERFANCSGISPKNGRLSNPVFDNDKDVKAFYEVIERADAINSLRSSSDVDDAFTCDGERVTVSGTHPKQRLTKSYPRRNGICYRDRVETEEQSPRKVRRCVDSLAVVCFVDDKSVTHNSVVTKQEVEDTLQDLVSKEQVDTTQKTEGEVSTLPPKRQRRPPQSYSPSNSHGNCSIARTRKLFRKKPTLSRQLSFDVDGATVEADVKTEDSTSQSEGIKKTSSKNKTKIKPDKEISVGSPNCVDNVSYILGLRRLYRKENRGQDTYQVLVQFRDGTSNWVSSDDLQSKKSYLGDFLCDSNQSIHVVNRLPFQVYCEPISSTKIKTGECEDKMKKGRTRKLSRLGKDKELRVTSSQGPKNTCSVPEEEIVAPSNADPVIKVEQQTDTQVPSVSCETEDSNPLPRPIFSQAGSNHMLTSDTFSPEILHKLLDGNQNNVEQTPTKDIEVTKDDFFVHIVVSSKHASQRNKRINPEVCDKIIELLEKCSVDDSVHLVILSGLEEHFSTKLDLTDVSRVPSHMESHECKHSVLKLRYLFQTIRHYCKPLIGVINKPCRGLSASMLSLFDMVYDKERGVEVFESPHKRKELSVLFPRLMGLTTRSEQLLMGDPVNYLVEDSISQTEVAFRGSKYSYNLNESLKDVKGNLRKRYFPSNQNSNEITDVHLIKPEPTSPALEKRRLKETDLLKKQLEREKELAASCLKDISLFWKELRNHDLGGVLS